MVKIDTDLKLHHVVIKEASAAWLEKKPLIVRELLKAGVPVDAQENLVVMAYSIFAAGYIAGVRHKGRDAGSSRPMLSPDRIKGIAQLLRVLNHATGLPSLETDCASFELEQFADTLSDGQE